MDKLSYAIGLSLGQNMKSTGVQEIPNYDDFIKGVKTAMSGEKPAIEIDEANDLLKKYFTKVQKDREAAEKLEREIHLKKSEEYLKENAAKDGVKSTDSGLQYKVLKEGQILKSPTSHSRVEVHYEGRLIDGEIFDSSYKRGEPATFGLNQVIPGWTEGLQLMREGSVYEFTIPPQLGYGEVGVPGHIPGNSCLIFKVELIKVLD